MIPILRLAPLDEEAETPSPIRRHRKRRLVFADDVMKLSKEDLRHNMSSAEDLKLPEEQVCVRMKAHRARNKEFKTRGNF